PRNDHPDDRDADVRSGLIEHEKVMARTSCNFNAGVHLLAHAVQGNVNAKFRTVDRLACRDQEWMALETQRGDTGQCRVFATTTSHEADREKLAQLGQRAQERDAGIEVGARTELDIFPTVLRPVHDRDIGGNAEIVGYVEHPQFSPGVSKLRPDIADIGIVELIEINLVAPEPVVPPDRVGIAFDQFEETLNDGFLAGVAGRATIGVGVEVIIEKVKQAGWQIFEATVAQRPDRRPFDLLARVERIGSWMGAILQMLMPCPELGLAEE